MKADLDFERFNLRHLRYFLAVCDCGSFRAASAKLHIAQSAVSRRVADLERIFGVQLLERRPRGVEVTAAGAALRDSARTINDEIETAHAMLDRYERGEVGTVAVGFFGTTVRLSFVPEIIARFRAALPQIRIDIRSLRHDVPNDASLTALDAAFVEGAHVAEGRETMLIAGGSYVVALPRDHPLAARDAIPFAELSQYDLIGIPQVASPRVYDQLIREAAQRGQALNIIHENESEASRLAFAAAGMGMTLVSPLAINHLQQYAVAYRPIADVDIPFELWLSLKPGGSMAARTLADLARTLLGELPTLTPASR